MFDIEEQSVPAIRTAELGTPQLARGYIEERAAQLFVRFGNGEQEIVFSG